MDKVNGTQPERKDTSGNRTWSEVLTGILFITTCLLVLGFFLQSVMSVF